MATTQAPVVPQLPVTYIKALFNRFSEAQLTDLTVEKQKPLFVYGSLMFPSQIAHILSDSESADQIASQTTPAILYDHERLAVRDAPFPALVKSAAVYMRDIRTEVDGLLVFDLTDSQRKDLDDYEAGLYNLMPVEVWVEVVGEGGSREEGKVERKKRTMVNAETYVWAGRRDELVEVAEKEWDVDEILDRWA
ncbi:hypothetical protein MMC17_002796 [Xylographa soralifera]|nr:hypothetical protein [Xylographa soralifera]